MAPFKIVLLATLYLLAINAAAYMAFAVDKQRARRRLSRARESTLLLLCAAGGSPAGFAAQRLIRHKTRKRSFQIAFWLVVCVQIIAVAAAVGWL